MDIKIVINDKNEEKIRQVLDEVQKKCTARTITYEDILTTIKNIENYLNIPKKCMVGIKANVDINGQSFLNAYKYTPESTHFTVERNKAGWTLTSIYRGRTRGYTQRYRLTLTTEAEQAILENYREY